MASAPIRSIDRDEPDSATIVAAALILRQGGLVAFATETVYGLGADATNPEAVARLFAAKGRPSFNPLIVHVDSEERARQCVAEWPSIAEMLTSQLWPGPLTLVLPRSKIIPDIVTGGLETVGVRMPLPKVAQALIAAADVPLAAPSANRSAGISPTLASHVAADLGEHIDLILDSGQTTLGLESTVLDLTTREPRILRPGPISAERIVHLLGGTKVRLASGDSAAPDRPLSSPGQMAIHYAPRTPAIRVDGPEGLCDMRWPKHAGLIVVGEHDNLPEVPVRPRNRWALPTPDQAARFLYIALHQLDELELDQIVIVPPPDLPEWRAVRDRLWRATVPLTPRFDGE